METETICRPRRRVPATSAAALLIGVLCVLGCSASDDDSAVRNPDSRPVGSLEDVDGLAERDDLNLIFILIDTLRSDRLGCYGYERPTSPVMDYMAGTGLRFGNHRAQSSWTKTSMASLWTGLYPIRTGVLRHNNLVSAEARMPAETFAEAGFATAGIWRNGWVAPNFGFGQGFEIYQSPRGRQAPAALLRKPVAGRIDGTDIDAIFSGVEFMRANLDRRFFLYMHLMDVHQYVSTEDASIFGNTYSDAYDNSVRWTDEQVGVVFAELFRLGIGDRTVVVIASDHGEAFGEHGSEGHARDVHHEVVNTPFIISFPFKLNPGILIEAPTENIDVWPTLLELFGLPVPTESDGTSRANWLLGDRVADAEDLGFAHLDRSWGQPSEPSAPLVGVREGHFRLIHDVNDPERDRLYDLRSDRAELRPVNDGYRDKLELLRQRAEDYLTQSTPWEGGAPTIELDAMHLRQLRALGYSIED
jgi:arylsulfatase A-like enzyme